MKALILGANGSLGTALRIHLPTPNGGAWQVDSRGRDRCDLENAAHIERALDESEPDVVFNTAAYTNVDAAEDDADAAFRANALAPQVLALAVEKRGLKLVHYSTDFVFDGTLERPYDEFDVPHPQGVYARSKVAGEQLVARAARRVFVVRVGCLYGRAGRNFPSTILRRLKAGETVRAEKDRFGSPTWVMDVARVSSALAMTEHFGLYHATSQGETTWADYARFVCAELGLPGDRVQDAMLQGVLKAPRPTRAILDNRMLRLRGLDGFPDWKDAARAFIRDEAG